ncbi:hypothetical protein [Clostridium algoriphilum]|nr:hypothetical protein [Clostridium algoriphilum]
MNPFVAMRIVVSNSYDNMKYERDIKMMIKDSKIKNKYTSD